MDALEFGPAPGRRRGPRWQKAFAKRTFAVLLENLQIAATWDAHLTAMKDDDARKCCLLYNLLRLEHLSQKERVLYYHMLKGEGAFAPPGATAKKASLKPVTALPKIVGTIGCVLAFVLPMWWLLVIARKFNAAGAAGKKMKRICSADAFLS